MGLGTGTCNLFLSIWGGGGERMRASPAADLPLGTQLRPHPGCSVHARPLFRLGRRPFGLSWLELLGLITLGVADLVFQGVSVSPCFGNGDSCEA